MGWQVTAEMVVVPADTHFGRQMVHVNRHGMLPGGVPNDRIQHLLSLGMIRATRPGPAVAGAAEPHKVGGVLPPATVTGPDPGQPAPVAELSDERRAAMAKLPASGLPRPEAAKPVWVEAAVARGYDYTASCAATKAELIDLLKG